MPASARPIATRAAALWACACALVAPVAAQDAPAHLAYVEGSVSLTREDDPGHLNGLDPLIAQAGQAIVAGDRLRTSSGRAEVWFPDGSRLALDTHTSVELRSATSIYLSEGRVMLLIASPDERDEPDGANSRPALQIETPSGSVVSRGPGEYRVSLSSDRAEELVELAVVGGSAELVGDGGSVIVRSNERAFVRLGATPSYPQVSMTRPDAFDRWLLARRDDRRRHPAAARLLPANLQMYGDTFDRHGTWGQEVAYGAVWYPRVDSGWRPYSHGFWTPLRSYGWTWIGLDAWGWPTHHYGRWGHRHSRWFWIPDRHWGPAWVSWAGAPGYLSWCPLGFDNRPVFALSASVGHTWDPWVVTSRQHFGGGGRDGRRYATGRPSTTGRHRGARHASFALTDAPDLPSFQVQRAGSLKGRVADSARQAQSTGTVGDARRGRSPATREPDSDRPGQRTDDRSWRSGPLQGTERPRAHDRSGAASGPRQDHGRPESGAEQRWRTRRLPQSRRPFDDRWSTEPSMEQGPSRTWAAPERGATPSPRRAPQPDSSSTIAPGPLLPRHYQDRASDHPIYTPRGTRLPHVEPPAQSPASSSTSPEDRAVRRHPSAESSAGTSRRDSRGGESASSGRPSRESGGDSSRAVPRQDRGGDRGAVGGQKRGR